MPRPKTSFPHTKTRSKGVLDLVHSGICSPMSMESIIGSNYFVTFIDDYSRKTWIYFLNTKGEIFSQFQELKALAENQIKKKIKVLIFDNWGHYTSNEFQDFYREAVIKKELAIPYNC